MRPLLRLTFALLAVLSFAACGHAQLIQVRPGYVRAPFVRVIRNADGSTQVRAPFVHINPAPRGLQYRVPVEEAPSAVPPGDALGQLNWRSLRLAIRESATSLETELNGFPTRDYWRGHLQTAEILTLVSDDTEDPPPADVQGRLREILQLYDTVRQTRELAAIAQLPSFETLYAELAEYVVPAQRRLQRQLGASARQLDLALTRIRDGSEWQKHLALPPGFGVTAPDPQELASVLDRFEAIGRNVDQREIAELPSFQVTHQLLAAYLKSLKSPSSRRAPAREELPLPAPNRR